MPAGEARLPPEAGDVWRRRADRVLWTFTGEVHNGRWHQAINEAGHQDGWGIEALREGGGLEFVRRGAEERLVVNATRTGGLTLASEASHTGGYESAPATRLLATHCASCNRPLLDSVSVEMGMGPDCRARFLRAPTGLSNEGREEANRLVHKIAMRHGQRPSMEMMTDVARLRELGFDKLADRLVERCCTVHISMTPDRILVKAPYSELFIANSRRIPGRIWDGDRKINSYPKASARQLYDVLKASFSGQLGYGPKGAFAI